MKKKKEIAGATLIESKRSGIIQHEMRPKRTGGATVAKIRNDAESEKEEP